MVELKLIKNFNEIGLETLKDFPYWISSEDLDTNISLWDEVDPPEELDELDEGLTWIKFPEDFSRQELNDQSGKIAFWTSDLIELAKKNNGILFICEGWEQFESARHSCDTFTYPSVFFLMRFKSKLDRMAAARDIRRQRRNLPLFLGEHPEEPGQNQRLDFWAIARSELESSFKKS